ncbi:MULTISPECIES: hypothetical protein [Oceanobacillus]|uniref:Uncharacterized protein n=2 Tax=Oceanobacillus TaxID=182709 RepID=A0A9X0YS75_9BACI|nr:MULTISPECIES: hypothetical protein [Oceanobacillus]MBR3119510.1 hypothetical protein [Oceanobacillus sp.]PAE28796.1 hypothetical protein CHI07_12295 [Paenibacillus sp. 7884-2]MBP2077121.1 hypothetical protein [Oceanobacillus polygoni]MCM3397517.1 hypothetical protein [Oceanobacillus profundus]MDO6448587.1 hypothetical protein [Oceanobacillus profundus]
MKATFKLPKTKKGWFGVSLIAIIILLGGWPIINIFNQEIIVFGLPLIMVWSILIIFLTTFSMAFINKIGGVD